MLRLVGRSTLAAVAVASVGTTAYVSTDPGARRSFNFWRGIGPVVGKYIQTGLMHKYYLKSDRATKSAAFQQLHEENAPRVLEVLLQLRGIFIKAGQYLSVRPEITPEPYRRQFKILQTAAPCEPLEVIVKVIEDEFGRPFNELYESIETRPCGSASTAQAHVAHLKGSNEKVVVKVQYPDAEAMFESDIVSLSQLARLLVWMDEADGDLESLLQEFSKQFLNEFDYVAEQQSMSDIGSALRDHPAFSRSVVVPEVVPGLCSRRVITMTYLPGPTLEKKASALLARAGVDLRQVGTMLDTKEKDGEQVRKDQQAVEVQTKSTNQSDSLALLGRAVVKCIGPNTALRLWSFADYLWRLGQRVVVWAILDVAQCRYDQNEKETENGMRNEDDIAKVLKKKGPLTWGAWAGRTRIELEEIKALSDIGAWINVLMQVHGYEIFGEVSNKYSVYILCRCEMRVLFSHLLLLSLFHSLSS